MTTEVLIKKKSGILQDYNREKIFIAIRKSAVRAGVTLTEQQELDVVLYVENNIFNRNDNVVPVEQMHELVIAALCQYAPEVGVSYREYHDWAKREAERIAQNESECQSIQYGLKKDNANMDTALVSTKRAKKMEVHEKSAFQKYNLTRDQLQAVEDGYIYVHDQSFRRDTMNCFSRKTKFLTNQGIRSFNDFYNGEKIVVLTHKANWKDAVVRSYGKQEVQLVRFRRMDGMSKEIVVTPNHRWILEDGSETTNLSIGDVLYTAPNASFTYKDADCIRADLAWAVEEIYKNLGEEQVWCLEVEDDHSFILDGGIVTGNCCLFDVAKVLSGGFEMGNIWYSEPKTLDTAFDVIGDIVLSAASQQYGGFTLCQVDEILAPYAEKSYQKYLKKYLVLAANSEKAEEMARQDTLTEMRQGFQGWEYKFNTVGSSRGDYPFITTTLGKGTQKWAPELSIAALETRMGGQGKEGFKKPVLFPKIVFLYDENLHGPGKELEDVFEAGVKCSAKTMYPDWLSLTGKGYIASMYKRYGKVISPMGCVDGKEIVTYKFHGQLYVESFERMWNRLSDNFEPKTQIKGQKHLYMDLENVQIYDTEKGFVNVERIIRNVSDRFMDVHFSNGRRLLCTADHPFEIVDKGVVKAEKLSKGDKLLINSNQYCEETVKFNEDKAWLLGLMLCDGCYQNYHISASIAAHGEDEIEQMFHKTFQKYFGMTTKTVFQERGEKGTYKDLCAIADDINHTQSVTHYFTTKFGGINKINRHIPNEVFSWNYEAKLAFMAGMIDADGHINSHTNGGSIVQIGSVNKELALQQMALAQAIGIPAKIFHNHYTKRNPNAVRYRVEFYAVDELMPYIVCEKKRNNFEEACSEHYNTYAEVLNVSPVNKKMYSYDVTTDSGHFEVSGIYSHNCRAFLSPWYERGGMSPADENDEPVFIGRFNVGAVSLNLPMILAKSKRECKDFYEVLDYYLEIIRSIHLQTYAYLGRMKASSNPLAYCEGGFYKGTLKQEDNIEPCLEAATASFGITAFNELQRLYNGKSLAEEAKAYIERTGLTDSTEVKESFNDESLFDLLGYTYDKDQYGFTSNVHSGFFALDVLQYINMKVEQYKKEDGKLYAIYGTPAESLCFEGNTPVLTNDGYKPIKDIRVGDMVYSYDENTHITELNKVVASRCTQKNAHVIKIRLSNSAEFICTPNHPFAVIGKNTEVEWKQAGDLEVGADCVLVMKHDFSSYWAKVIAKECEEPTDVYNIEVEFNHNYFVGKENSVLVHNCGLQIKQFRKEFGIIEGVSDREYVSNSFHCHVTEDITPIQKQDYEGLFWEMSNGGKIQYVRYPINYNHRALKTLIRRAMDKGFYEGVNLSLAYCDDCGHEELEMDVCPKCGSKNLTKIDRMNGYLAYSRVHGDTRLNAAKMAEIAERKSM